MLDNLLDLPASSALNNIQVGSFSSFSFFRSVSAKKINIAFPIIKLKLPSIELISLASGKILQYMYFNLETNLEL